MPYDLHQSDKLFEIAKQNTIRKWKNRKIIVEHS
jgi:hypothetical protein